MTLDALIQEVRTLPIEQRKQLVMAILDSLTMEQTAKLHSLLELEGLGAHLWQGIDAQAYVDESRRDKGT
jgi:hypothetical protein